MTRGAPQTHQMIEALKRILRSRGITYRDLARGSGLSEAGVKRILSGSRITLDRLESFAELAGVDLIERLPAERVGRQADIEKLTRVGTRDFGIHLALRPWKFSVLRRLS